MANTINTLSQSQIKSLLTAETKQLEQPVKNWQAQIKVDQTQISAWGQIGGALTTLASDTAAIQNPTSFNNRAASSSAQSVATVSVTRGAALGTYQLSQVQPSQSQSVYSQIYASDSTSLGSGAGTLSFTLASGQTETVSVGAGGATLAGIVEAVNTQSGGDVQASLVGGSSGYRLVLSSVATGASSAFSMSGTGSLAGPLYSAGGSSNTFSLATAGSDASMDVNGIPISNADNQFTQAIPGATVTVTGAGSSSVAITQSGSRLASAVSTVIGDVSSAVQAVQSATAFDPGGAKGNGPLLGNFSANDIANELQGAVSGLSAGGVSARDAGIKVNSDGSIAFDSGTFASAYQANPQAVESLVSALYTQLHAVTQSTVGSTVTGTVAEQTHTLNSSVKNLKGEITQETRFVNAQVQNDANAYGNLLNVQSQYSQWNNYLSAIFNQSGSSND